MNASDSYKEEVKNSLDALSFNDNEIRKQATDSLIYEIENNPKLFETIFNSA